jgi:hypothetical protein
MLAAPYDICRNVCIGVGGDTCSKRHASHLPTYHTSHLPLVAQCIHGQPSSQPHNTPPTVWYTSRTAPALPSHSLTCTCFPPIQALPFPSRCVPPSVAPLAPAPPSHLHVIAHNGLMRHPAHHEQQHDDHTRAVLAVRAVHQGRQVALAGKHAQDSCMRVRRGGMGWVGGDAGKAQQAYSAQRAAGNQARGRGHHMESYELQLHRFTCAGTFPQRGHR